MGEDVVACGVTVQSVPANEGFWIGDTADERLWVEIVTTGESIVRVRPGQRVTLRGTVVEHGPDFPAKAGVDASEGADALARDRYHLEVPETQVRFP
jgi:hypothetical protein